MAQAFYTALHQGLALALMVAQLQHLGKHSAQTNKFTLQQPFFTVILGTEMRFHLTLLLKMS